MARREALVKILEECRYNGDAPGSIEFIRREGEDERLWVNDEFNMNELAKRITW